jgi:hypothetical protein
VKAIGDLPSVNAIEKFVYFRVAMLNVRWSNKMDFWRLRNMFDLHKIIDTTDLHLL